MTVSRFLFCFLVFSGFFGPSWAADFSDPTWPCIQRKVENLSIGLMWPSPIGDRMDTDSGVEAEIRDLADSLALRRSALSGLEPRVAAFAEAHDGDAELLGQVFKHVFDSLSGRRTRIIRGIGEFSLSQIALSQRIDGMRVEMDAEMAKEDPDFDRVDSLEEQLDWDQLIYTDRQQSITYLCETPILLEKRLYAVAQMLQYAVATE